MKYVVSCGGTGGHMYPGLAVAAALAGRGHAVSVILSGRSVESEKPGNGLPPGVGAWRASIPRPQPRRPLSCIRWAFSAIPLFFKFLRHRPDALLAMGSYTSIPPVLAARAALVPVVFHEANALPGKAVRALAPLARKICVAFPGMEPRFPRGCRVVKTGMPLRAGFSRGLGGSRADKTRFNLLVMGGSQGAQNLNKLVVEAFAAAAASDPAALERRHFRIVHLAGRTGESEVRALWSASGAAKCGVE
ncbi:MAG: UDP-N-acetylglucosamine--N-acetylmuramyl-(pentapeptide) pyrophosphoryl-undecaprenol N-acetylglucosamine transferase, partial [Kiritimatiellae bacterium]|nr:UDP-N-acetylglucosamine--N-acetylmuramyl-(pentapeptide) pyrophosphoryl-undecaprenol N-acetylglucosamine transferase [Kiritimatiellia bacterium]